MYFEILSLTCSDGLLFVGIILRLLRLPLFSSNACINSWSFYCLKFLIVLVIFTEIFIGKIASTLLMRENDVELVAAQIVVVYAHKTPDGSSTHLLLAFSSHFFKVDNIVLFDASACPFPCDVPVKRTSN